MRLDLPRLFSPDNLSFRMIGHIKMQSQTESQTYLKYVC